MCVAGRRGGGREGTRDTLTHRVKDWVLHVVMCVAGRRGGGREETRDTLTHSQGQRLGPTCIVYFSSVGHSTHINNFLILHAVDMISLCRSASCHQDGCTDEEVKDELKLHHTTRPGLISTPEVVIQ